MTDSSKQKRSAKKHMKASMFLLLASVSGPVFWDYAKAAPHRAPSQSRATTGVKKPTQTPSVQRSTHHKPVAGGAETLTVTTARRRLHFNAAQHEADATTHITAETLTRQASCPCSICRVWHPI